MQIFNPIACGNPPGEKDLNRNEQLNLNFEKKAPYKLLLASPKMTSVSLKTS